MMPSSPGGVVITGYLTCGEQSRSRRWRDYPVKVAPFTTELYVTVFANACTQAEYENLNELCVHVEEKTRGAWGQRR